MSAYALPRQREDALGGVIALCAGGLILLLRAQALSLGPARSAALVVLYMALCVLSVTARAPALSARRLSPAVVGIVGVGAFGAIAFAPWQSGGALAFGAGALVLGIVAAIAEEAFFRRLMYGWLERWWGAGAAIVLSAAAFALVHVPLYGASVLWVDLGAGLLLSWQRWASGSWAAPAAAHAFANVLAVVR